MTDRQDDSGALRERLLAIADEVDDLHGPGMDGGDARKLGTRIRDVAPAGPTEAEDRFEHYVSQLIDKNPDVRALGERLGDLLEPEDFNGIEPILLGIAERLSPQGSEPAGMGDLSVAQIKAIREGDYGKANAIDDMMLATPAPAQKPVDDFADDDIPF